MRVFEEISVSIMWGTSKYVTQFESLLTKIGSFLKRQNQMIDKITSDKVFSDVLFE